MNMHIGDPLNVRKKLLLQLLFGLTSQHAKKAENKREKTRTKL